MNLYSNLESRISSDNSADALNDASHNPFTSLEERGWIWNGKMNCVQESVVYTTPPQQLQTSVFSRKVAIRGAVFSHLPVKQSVAVY